MNNKVQAQFEQHSDNRWIVIIDRTLNRNSDRVITLIAAAPRDRVCLIVIYWPELDVHRSYLRRFNSPVQVPRSAIYTNFWDLLTDRMPDPLRSVS